jgi:hypothetical protein
MSTEPEDTKRKTEVRYTEQGHGTCGVLHDDCPNAWKGSCDRSSPHDGSHHCGSCNSSF